jgi:hypothetical protein
MYKEIHAFRRKPLQEPTRSDFVRLKALELTHRPCHERLIDDCSTGYSAEEALRPCTQSIPVGED